MGGFRFHCAAVAVVALLLATPLAAAGQAPTTEQPFTSAADLVAGEKMFRSHCTLCHGRSGRGDRGPNLTRGVFRRAPSGAALFTVLRRGVPGTDMPGLYQGERASWQLVAFVRSLSATGSTADVPGDSEAGRQIFHEQEDCAECHGVNGQGGRGVPNLSEVGWRRAPSHLRASVVDPNAEVDPRWWGVRLTDRNGDTVMGWRLNEDRYSVRLLDRDDNLRSFQKNDLREFERLETSPMASYADVLSAQELDDLVAYLHSLRGSAR